MREPSKLENLVTHLGNLLVREADVVVVGFMAVIYMAICLFVYFCIVEYFTTWRK